MALHPPHQLDQRLRNPPWVESSGSHVADRPALSCSLAMSFALLYAVVRFLLDALLTRRQLRSGFKPRFSLFDTSSVSSSVRSVAPAGSRRTVCSWPPSADSCPAPPARLCFPALRHCSDGIGNWFADAGQRTGRGRAAGSPPTGARSARPSFASLGRTLAGATPHPRVPMGRLTR